MRTLLNRFFNACGTRLLGPRFPALWALPDIRFLLCSVLTAVPAVLWAIFHLPASRPFAATAAQLAYVVIWTLAILFDIPNRPGWALIPAAFGYGLVLGVAWSAATTLPAGLMILFTSAALQFVSRRRGQTIAPISSAADAPPATPSLNTPEHAEGQQ